MSLAQAKACIPSKEALDAPPPVLRPAWRVFSSRANTFAVWFVYEGNGGCEGPESRRQDVELQAEYLWESLTTDTC